MWVYITIDHWWPAAPHSMAPTSTSCPSPVQVRSKKAAWAAIAAAAPVRHDASGLPGLSGSRSGSPVRYMKPPDAQSISGLCFQLA